MDGQDYLNQISAKVKTDKKLKLSFINSTIFKVIVGGIVAFLAIMLVGNIINNSNAGEKDQAISLKLNIDAMLDVISTYQPSVKSSTLRSNSASLYSVLSNTNRDLLTFIRRNYTYSSEEVTKKFSQAVALERNGLKSALFEAKINGILDQVYANKMAYVTSLIYTKEVSLYNTTSNGSLREILSSSANSLSTLYDQFNDFQK